MEVISFVAFESINFSTHSLHISAATTVFTDHDET